FGSTWLAPRMREFMEVYPEIEVHMILTDQELDLSMREADVAVRFTPPRQADLIQRHLLTFHMHVYAAPNYIKKHGLPRTVQEIDNHRVIVYGNDTKPPVPEVNWLLKVGRDNEAMRQPAMTVNNAYALMRVIQSGAGLGALPDYMVQEGNELVSVLEELQGPQIDAYFVYPEEVRATRRISVFRDFLLRQVAQSKF
ncbi:MAG: substrate binding domain-containing protein, partial [Alphaproteobacteria bacterium]|nr:substrate binding domain-containing protein [Alphaproteobacteria bacterium]